LPAPSPPSKQTKTPVVECTTLAFCRWDPADEPVGRA
jgi:hypothetical protein